MKRGFIWHSKAGAGAELLRVHWKLRPRFVARKYLAVLAVIALAALSSCTSAASSASSAKTGKQSETEKQSEGRKAAPDFTLTDANGKPAKLSDYRGKVVLLDFWATWCGPCQIEIPWFIEFEQQFKSKGLEVVGVSMDEDGWQAVKPYLAERKINYRILLGDDSVAQLYGGLDALPTTFLIDRDGKFAFTPHIGLTSKNEFLSEIQTLLSGKQNASVQRHLLPVPAAVLPRPGR